MLHCAAAMGHCDIIEYLISLDLDIDEEDLNFNTPLMSAIYNNKEESVFSLLKMEQMLMLSMEINSHPYLLLHIWTILRY